MSIDLGEVQSSKRTDGCLRVERGMGITHYERVNGK